MNLLPLGRRAWQTGYARWTGEPSRLAFLRLPQEGKNQQAEQCQSVPGLLYERPFRGMLSVGQFAILGTRFCRKYSVPDFAFWPTSIVGKNHPRSTAFHTAIAAFSPRFCSYSCPQPETLTLPPDACRAAAWGNACRADKLPGLLPSYGVETNLPPSAYARSCSPSAYARIFPRAPTLAV
jgi:hypothetical protein